MLLVPLLETNDNKRFNLALEVCDLWHIYKERGTSTDFVFQARKGQRG